MAVFDEQSDFSQALVSFKRLNDFLNAKEIDVKSIEVEFKCLSDPLSGSEFAVLVCV